MSFHFAPTRPAQQRDFASMMKGLVAHRSPLGEVARRIFGKAKPPRIVRPDARVARMSMRVALFGPSHVKHAVMAAVVLASDRVFVDVPAEVGRVGICADRRGQ